MSKRDLILFSKSHIKGLVKPIIEKLEIDRIYIINLTEKGKGIIRLFYDIYKNDDKRTFIFLDYRPLIILVLLKYIKSRGHNVIFIQHGYFEISGSRNLKRRSVKWYLDSFYFVGIYLILGTGSEKNIFKRIDISIQAFLKGASKVSTLLTQHLEWDYAFIYDKSSEEIFGREFLGLIRNLNITGTLDEESFKYDKNGKSIYVSQPLHKTGHLSEKGYRNYLIKLFENNSDLLFLSHPKIEREWIEKITEPERIITKKDLVNKFKTKMVIGHFSSILLGIDDRIQLRIDDVVGDEYLKECKFFNPQIKIEFNGLVGIKDKLE